MGRKSAAESIARICLAFLHQRTWTQAGLARHIGIGVPALRRCLSDLHAAGMPLDSEDEHPHVYWSVPKDWCPGGIALGADDAQRLARILCRLPVSPDRDHLLQSIRESLPNTRRPSAVIPPHAPEAPHLPVVEDAAASRRALYVRYFSANRGSLEWRDISPVQVHYGPRARALAICHRSERLKWFRVDNIVDTSPSAEPYRPADPASVDTYVRESLDGFHGGDEAVECSFIVRAPEASWVQRNLPPETTYTPVDSGIRVQVKTAGVVPLARFVTGLGAAAQVETPELAGLVRELAEGALSATALPAKSLPVRRRSKALRAVTERGRAKAG